MLTEKPEVPGERPVPLSLCPTHPICTGLGLNVGLCGKRLEYNQLSISMAVDFSCISIMVINIDDVSQN